MQNNDASQTPQNNIHNPVRYEGESFLEYQIRRKLSASIVKANTQNGNGGISSRKALRDEIRYKGRMKNVAGQFGQGLRNWITRNQLAQLANKG